MIKSNNNSYQRKPYNRNNNNKPRRHTMNVEFILSNDIDKDVAEEIYNVINSVPFDKISYTLVCPRCILDPTVDNPNKTTVVGYINSFNTNNEDEFNVTIFDSAFETINSLENLRIVPDYITHRDGSFNLITRLKIVGDFKKEDAQNDVESEESDAVEESVCDESDACFSVDAVLATNPWIKDMTPCDVE